MDIGDTIAPTSDQLDAVDLLTGPRTFTIKAVRGGNAEQPVQIDLAEFPRPWRPGKSMRRVLVSCWGADASVYVGRRVTLYCDPSVKFGGEAIGGTRISHLSHIEKAARVPLIITRGKSAIFTVQPLVERTVSAPSPAEPPADVEMITDRDTLRAMWRGADPQTRAQIEARIAALDAEADLTNGAGA